MGNKLALVMTKDVSCWVLGLRTWYLDRRISTQIATCNRRSHFHRRESLRLFRGQVRGQHVNFWEAKPACSTIRSLPYSELQIWVQKTLGDKVSWLFWLSFKRCKDFTIKSGIASHTVTKYWKTRYVNFGINIRKSALTIFGMAPMKPLTGAIEKNDEP